MAATGSQPCGACRFLRRKCSSECIFAPYFCSEQGPASFAAIHRVFGASNVSKLLSHVPPPARRDAITTVAFEAQSRIKDPVYGVVSQVLALQQQVEYLQEQVMQIKVELTRNRIDGDCDDLSRFAENNQWSNSNVSAENQRPTHAQLCELQELALKMMKSRN